MPNYGIKLIWGGNLTYIDKVVGFTDWAYEKWGGKIKPGTRMLLYETKRNNGAEAIVSEVQVVADFDETARLGLPSPTEEHSHLVKIKIIRNKGDVIPIPREQVKLLLESPGYPQASQSWKPISEALYKQFLGIWDTQ